MCIRQPCVQWEQRDFYRKSNKESQEQPQGGVAAKSNLACSEFCANRHVVKAACVDVQPDDRSQHEYRCDHGVEEELDRGVNPALVSPDSDQQRHGNQRGLPEDVKEKQIQRQEDPDHRSFQDQ